MSQTYDSPQYQIIREDGGSGLAGGAATTEYSKFVSFVAQKLLRVNAHVTVAGTVAGHGFDVYIGTTSVGTIALGTSAATTNASVSIAAGLQDVAALQGVSVKSLADATGKAVITYEYKNKY